MKSVEKIAATLLISVSIILMVLFAYVATGRPLTQVEAIGLQFLALFAGLLGSYIFGRQVSRGSIGEIIKPYARSAFRRLISLYRSLSRVARIIEEDGHGDATSKISIIKAIVVEQIATANDALADWEDVVPESVEELRREMKIEQQRESNNG